MLAPNIGTQPPNCESNVIDWYIQPINKYSYAYNKLFHNSAMAQEPRPDTIFVEGSTQIETYWSY